MLRFVFRLLLPTSVSPIDCFLVPPGSDVLLARCLVAFPGFCGFCEWPMRPDCCAPPVVSARSRLPGFSICCFVDPPPPSGVLPLRCPPISSPRFATPVFFRFSATDLLPALSAPASGCCRSGVFLFRFFQTSPGFVALLRRADSFFVAECNRSVPLSHRVFPVSLPRSRRPRFRFFVLSSRFCCSFVIVVNRRFSFFAGSPVGCFLPAVLLR